MRHLIPRYIEQVLKSYNIDHMKKQVLLTFLGVNKGRHIELQGNEETTYKKLLELVQSEKKKWQDESKIRDLRAYLRSQDPAQNGPPKYISISRKDRQKEVLEAVYGSSPLEVEYFCPKNEDSLKKIILNIGIDLDDIKRRLSTLTHELKDEANQINLPGIIRRTTSKDEEIVEVFLVVCDPLVEVLADEQRTLRPLYHDQVDPTSHVQRLRKASLSNSDLTIKVTRVFGTKAALNQALRHSSRNSENHLFSVVQIFTRVEKREGKLVMSVQSQVQVGCREWASVESILGGPLLANVVVVVGVGVWQIVEAGLNLQSRVVCISTISMQEKRILANIDERNPLETENSYNDHYSQLFLEEFYSHLFRRNRIQESYDYASELAKNYRAKNIWCCCLHPHYPACPWNLLAQRIGEPQAHRLFKHSFSDWAKVDYFTDSLRLQLLLSGGKQSELTANGVYWNSGCCASDALCCSQLMQLDKKILHTTLSRVISSAGKEPDEQLYAHIVHRSQRPNRFQAQTYDKPIGIRPPLTVFLAVRHIRTHPISFLRSSSISQAKRLFRFVKEYVQARNTCLQFFQFRVGRSQTKSFKEEMQVQVEAARRKSGERMGASVRSRTQHVYVWAVHSKDKASRYYQKLLEQYWEFVEQESARSVKLKFILLIQNQSFGALQLKVGVLSPPKHQNHSINLRTDPKMEVQLQLDDSHPAQRYHSVLSRHSYSHIVANLPQLEAQILQGQFSQTQCALNFEDYSQQNQKRLQFMGFLSQFGQQGFFLTPVTQVILCELFEEKDEKLLQQALRGEMAVSCIQLGDCTSLQLSRHCLEQFNARSSNSKLLLLLKKLEFYYILMRLYFQLYTLTEAVHYPAPIRHYLSKQGIFSIDIALQSSHYKDTTLKCKQEIRLKPDYCQSLFSVTSVHVYHLNQIEHMLQELVRKKKNKHNPSSKSFIDEKMFPKCQYLVWNIVHRSWLIAQFLAKTLGLSPDHFEAQLVSFLDKTEISLPVAAVGAIQISILMNRVPPVLKDSQFGHLTLILGKYRHYAHKKQMLESLEPKWGKLQQFKDFFGNCFHLALTIGAMLDPEEKQDSLTDKEKEKLEPLRGELRMRHRMFGSSSGRTWRMECLRLIERKLLYYFSFTNELKKNQSLREFKEKSTLFDQYFKLAEIQYEFKCFIHKIAKEELEANNTRLMELYLQLQLGKLKSEPEPDCREESKGRSQEGRGRCQEGKGRSQEGRPELASSLAELKGKVSPEYMPIYSYLYQQLQQKTIFNQKDLIIFARARNILCQGQPYVYIRKRTLLTEYLGKVLRSQALKVSYFSLTEQTLSIFQKSQNNNCEVLCMILTVDCTEDGLILFGAQTGVDTAPMPLAAFAEKIKKCRIKVLILCGKNSNKLCEMLRAAENNSQQSSGHSISSSQLRSKPINSSAIRSKINPVSAEQDQTFPTLIAIQNASYSLCDSHIFDYRYPQEVGVCEAQSTTKHSLFNRQPSTYDESTEIELYQNQDFLNEISEGESVGLVQDYSKQNEIVEVGGRVIFPTVSLKKAESQSEEERLLGIEEYIGNEVNQMGMDLIVITIVKSITSQLKTAPRTFQEAELQELLAKSIETVRNILGNRFECVKQVFEQIRWTVWSNRQVLPQVSEGKFEDLTKNFYCAENNLNDQIYYQNVGSCAQVGQAISKLSSSANCIQILGGDFNTKANLLQELCWISQSKSLFKFGIIKVDLKEVKLSSLATKQFADRQNSTSQTRLLIAIDNAQQLNPAHAVELAKLKGKLFTLLYTTSSPQKGEELRQLLDLREYHCIDLNKRSQDELNKEVYANLLCHVKEKKEFMLGKEKLEGFESKVQEIMKLVKGEKGSDRLSKALELLRGGGRTDEDRNTAFLDFYQQHYEELVNTLTHVREITIKFK